jgi:hypothetical protein
MLSHGNEDDSALWRSIENRKGTISRLEATVEMPLPLTMDTRIEILRLDITLLM